jgi:hypothetical protein
MKETITYRPSVEPGKLASIIVKKLHYPKINRFIDEAVKEKIARETAAVYDAKTDMLVQNLSKVVYEHHGWKFHEVGAKMKKQIDRKAKPIETGKTKSHKWKGTVDNL